MTLKKFLSISFSIAGFQTRSRVGPQEKAQEIRIKESVLLLVGALRELLASSLSLKIIKVFT